jgi:hypothetical protein
MRMHARTAAFFMWMLHGCYLLYRISRRRALGVPPAACARPDAWRRDCDTTTRPRTEQ